MSPAYLRLLPVLAAVVITAASSAVQAQGYQGLFGGEDDAPAAQQRRADEPQGYQGLIPGAVAPAPAAQPKPTPGAVAPPTQQQPGNTALRPQNFGVGNATNSVVAAPSTQAPLAALGMKPIRNSDDLRQLAMIYSVDQNFDHIPDEMAAQFRLPETTTELLKQPRPRINGMLPMEQNVKNSIDGAMATLKDPKLRPQDRQARAKLAIESLKTIQHGLKIKAQTPDSTYKVMGLPPVYVKEEREGIANSIKRVDAALKQLNAL